MSIVSTFLIISPEPWCGLKVSKHHYAKQLHERGYKVYYLGPNQLEKYHDQGVTILANRDALSGIRFMPRWAQYFFLKWQWQQIVELNHLPAIDVVWSFDPSRLYDFRIFKQAKHRILHLVDYNQWFQGPIAAKTANLCIGVSDYIVDRFKPYNSNVIKVSHGFHGRESAPKPVALPGQQHVKAIYIGNLDIRYLDWNIIQEVAQENVEVDFIFLGKHDSGINETFERLMERKNCHHLTQRLPEEVSGFLAAADICLLAYRSDEFPEQLANPHKMLEYLGAGKTIVSTYCHEYCDFEGINMSLKNDQFSELFKQVVSELEEQNTSKLRKIRQDQANANTYSSKVDRVLKAIGHV